MGSSKSVKGKSKGKEFEITEFKLAERECKDKTIQEF